MAWQGLHLTTPCRLRLHKRRVEVTLEDDTTHAVPLEDLAWLLVDTGEATLTARLISACMEGGVAIIFSDSKHTPVGMALPFHQHFQQAAVAHRQIAVSQPQKKKLWQAIVKRKILNQAGNLEHAQHPDHKTLAEIARHVKSGDPDNTEARAARYYWPRFFDNFQRSDESDIRNALLNYGYAILRSAIARGLVAAGLIPAFGLHHNSIQNSFNLADDLIEPFRPAVDWLARERFLVMEPDAVSLSKEDRHFMAGILSETIILAEEQVTILTASERIASSLATFLANDKGASPDLPVTW